MYANQDETGNAVLWNFSEMFGSFKDAILVMDMSGFIGVTVKTGAINAGIAWMVSKLKGKESGTRAPGCLYSRSWSCRWEFG